MTTKKKLKLALQILDDMAGHPDDPCEHDRHGHWQVHGWFHDDRDCPNARAKVLLNAER